MNKTLQEKITEILCKDEQYYGHAEAIQSLLTLFQEEIEEANKKIIYELKIRLSPENFPIEAWTMTEKERQELLTLLHSPKPISTSKE